MVGEQPAALEADKEVAIQGETSCKYMPRNEHTAAWRMSLLHCMILCHK